MDGLDPKKGAELCQVEKFGDWYRDPWDWPELNWVVGHPEDFPWGEIIQKGGSGASFRNKLKFEPVIVPKSQLGVRPAVLMTLDAKITYHAASQRLVSKMHRDLPEWVYGWRSRGGKDSDASIPNNSDEWIKYAQFYEGYNGDCKYALQTDITSFFASIDVNRMSGLIYDIAGKATPAHILASVINEHDSLQTRNGLPQRSWSSAFLAHLYVRAIDDILDSRLRRKVIDGAARWMDDIHLIGDEPALHRLFIELQDRCREMGLEPNSSKSRLGPIEELSEQFYIEGFRELKLPIRTFRPGMASGASVVAVESSDEDVSLLIDLEAAILSNPHAAKMNVVKRLLIELRTRRMFDQFGSWLDWAVKMPHLSDTLGRYFREAIKLGDAESHERREQYIEWFHRFRRSDWARIPWVVAQYALAISSTNCDDEDMIENLRDWLGHSNDLQQVAIAAQRLSICDASCVRDVIRERIDHEARPLFQRVLALGLLASGDERKVVERVISQDSRNILTHRFLESVHYTRPKVPADFDSATDRKR